MSGDLVGANVGPTSVGAIDLSEICLHLSCSGQPLNFKPPIPTVIPAKNVNPLVYSVPFVSISKISADSHCLLFLSQKMMPITLGRHINSLGPRKCWDAPQDRPRIQL